MARNDDTSHASTLTIGALRRTHRMIEAFGVHASLPVPIEKIACSFGFTVMYSPNLAALYGMISMEGGERYININANLSPTWQRRTIAQMLGHWIAGHLNDELERTWDIWSSNTGEDAEASYIAAMLLIPDAALRADETRHSVACACEVPLELVCQLFDF